MYWRLFYLACCAPFLSEMLICMTSVLYVSRLFVSMNSATFAGQALKWFVYWRLFYLACSELFGYNGGEEWGVAHYLFEKK